MGGTELLFIVSGIALLWATRKAGAGRDLYRVGPSGRSSGALAWTGFTERARRILFFAQEEAFEQQDRFVATEHLLLALLKEEDHLAARTLRQQGIAPPLLRREIVESSEPGEGIEDPQELRLTPQARLVLELAFAEAKRSGNGSIGPEHLLLGLVTEEEGMAGIVLRKAGLTLEGARHILENAR